MRLNKREQNLLWMVLLLAFGFGNWLLILPLVRSWRDVQSKIGMQQMLRDGMQGVLDRDAPQWRTEYAKLQENLGERASVFVTTADVLKKVEDVGQECGLSVPVKKTLPVIERDVFRELPVQCTIEGSLEGLVKFLHTLQTASGLITVDQIQIFPPRPQEPALLKCDLVVIALASKKEKPSS